MYYITIYINIVIQNYIDFDRGFYLYHPLLLDVALFPSPGINNELIIIVLIIINIISFFAGSVADPEEEVSQIISQEATTPPVPSLIWAVAGRLFVFSYSNLSNQC